LASSSSPRIDLGVQIGSLALKNPVLTASGTFGYGLEFAEQLDLNRLGGICVKGLSLKPRPGNLPPRIMETPAGMLNAIGLQNVGVSYFISEYLPRLREYDTAVIANIFGETIEEYAAVAQALDRAEGVAAVEINVSCPNVTKGGIAFGNDPVILKSVVQAVRQATSLPVITKMTPNVTDIVLLARAAVEGGSDALSLINTLLGMSVDIETRTPHLRNVVGGLSGPAIRPVALRMVHQVYRAGLGVPLIGIGGIATPGDAIQFLICGASAIQVGTANYIEPDAAVQVCRGIEDYLDRQGLHSVAELTGSLKLPSAP
jgi:dihydroorotate dehydrogenase (NAD+) catalytic subunit